MFLQSCFIRKNTPELRKMLEELGYKLNHGKWMGRYLAVFKIKDTQEQRYVASPEWDLENNPDFHTSIDCGENEELFLALAALRDDSDYMQWFIHEYNEKITWFQDKVCDREIKKYGAGHPINSRKATVEEIIKHFNHE